MMHHLSVAWMCGHVGCWSPKCHRGWGGNVSRWFPNYQWCGCCWSKMIGIWHVVGDSTHKWSIDSSMFHGVVMVPPSVLCLMCTWQGGMPASNEIFVVHNYVIIIMRNDSSLSAIFMPNLYSCKGECSYMNICMNVGANSVNDQMRTFAILTKRSRRYEL